MVSYFIYIYIFYFFNFFVVVVAVVVIESNLLKNYPKDFKQVYYERYVDNIFVCLINKKMCNFFLNMLVKRHKP